MPDLFDYRPTPTNIVSWAFSGTYDPDKPIWIDASIPERRVTKNVAANLIARLAGAFEAGSTVCLHLDNDVLYPVLSLAIYASRCCWIGTNTSNTVTELEHVFKASETRYVIAKDEHIATVHAAVNNIGADIRIVRFTDILGESANDTSTSRSEPEQWTFPNLHELLDRGSPESLPRALKGLGPQTVATLMTTSGTTGTPKIAVRTHAALIHECDAIARHEHDEKPYEVRRLFCTPVFHSFTMVLMVLDTIRLGHPAYIMGRFHDSEFPAKIAQLHITETIAPPAMLLRLVNNPDCHANIRSLRTVFSGGAQVVPELRLRFLDLYPNEKPRISIVWGMTEGGWFTTFKYPEDDETGSVGRALPGLDIKVSRDSHVQLEKGGEAGELLVRGPQMMAEYKKNPTATQTAFTDGWLRTGDIGYVADDGKVYLVDRAKDLIKANGWQVSPTELEDALLVSSDVTDSGVVGVGHGVDEHPAAFVVARDPDLTETRVKQHLRDRLAGYKVRTCEIHFVHEIPRSPTGKILRNTLREMCV